MDLSDLPTELIVELVSWSPDLLKWCHLLSKRISQVTREIKIKYSEVTFKEIHKYYLTTVPIGILYNEKYNPCFYTLNFNRSNSKTYDIFGHVKLNNIRFVTVKQLDWINKSMIFGQIRLKECYPNWYLCNQPLIDTVCEHYSYEGYGFEPPSLTGPGSIGHKFGETCLIDIKSYYNILKNRNVTNAKERTIKYINECIELLKKTEEKLFMFLYLSCLTFELEQFTQPCSKLTKTPNQMTETIGKMMEMVLQVLGSLN